MPPAKAQPLLDPADFFAGETEGRGRIKILFRDPVRLSVRSVGHRIRGGGLVVNQRIEEGGKRARTRRWELQEIRPGSFTGTLTDADGPVIASTWGNTMRVTYDMKQGGEVEQWLVLSDDRSALENRMTVRRWGIPVAWVEERIEKR